MRIVVDAAALLEILLGTPLAPRVQARLYDGGDTLHAPELLHLEVLQTLRRYAHAGRLERVRAEQAIEVLTELAVFRHSHEPFLERIWELRANLTAYDAAYVALAEGLDAPLVTTDERLARAPGHRARIEIP